MLTAQSLWPTAQFSQYHTPVHCPGPECHHLSPPALHEARSHQLVDAAHDWPWNEGGWTCQHLCVHMHVGGWGGGGVGGKMLLTNVTLNHEKEKENYIKMWIWDAICKI